MACHTITEAVRRYVFSYGGVNQRRAAGGENAAAHAGSAAGRVAANGCVNERHSAIVPDCPPGVVKPETVIASRVPTEEPALHIQRPEGLGDATATAGSTGGATRIGVAGVIIADGSVRQI